MRLWGLMAVGCLAAGCGSGAEQAEQGKARGGGELTVTLPPTLPTKRAEEEAAPQAGFDTIAAAEPAAEVPPAPVKAAPVPKAPQPQLPEAPPQVEVAVAPAAESPPAATPAPAEAGAAPAGPAEAAAPDAPAAGARPAGASAWAGYLRKSGFPCRRIASASRVERAAGPGLEYYRVECEGGGSYQATNKRGHLFFRRWRG